MRSPPPLTGSTSVSSVRPKTRDQLVFPVLTEPPVNNVGKSHTAPVYFAEAAEKEVEDILRINVNANVRVTKLILPRMIERYCSCASPPSAPS